LEDTPVRWKTAGTGNDGLDKVKIRGRLLGGCLDVLIFLQGTKYDNGIWGIWNLLI